MGRHIYEDRARPTSWNESGALELCTIREKASGAEFEKAKLTTIIKAQLAREHQPTLQAVTVDVDDGGQAQRLSPIPIKATRCSHCLGAVRQMLEWKTRCRDPTLLTDSLRHSKCSSWQEPAAEIAGRWLVYFCEL
jgi:hypothetical protein